VEKRRCAFSTLALLGLVACGGGPREKPDTRLKPQVIPMEPQRAPRAVPPAPLGSRAEVHLGGEGLPAGLGKLQVSLRALALQDGEGRWVPLPLHRTSTPVNLLDPQGTWVASATSLPPGSYHACRVEWEGDGRIQEAGGEERTLHLLGKTQETFPLHPPLETEPSGRLAFRVLLDLERALQREPGQLNLAPAYFRMEAPGSLSPGPAGRP
jgi:hypothetical protein